MSEINFMERADATLDFLDSDFGNSGGVKGMIIACEIEKAYNEGKLESEQELARLRAIIEGLECWCGGENNNCQSPICIAKRKAKEEK